MTRKRIDLSFYVESDGPVYLSEEKIEKYSCIEDDKDYCKHHKGLSFLNEIVHEGFNGSDLQCNECGKTVWVSMGKR